VGAERLSKEDGYLYRVRLDRVICRVVDGQEYETIDSFPLRLLAGTKVMTGANWECHLPISVFYQRVIGPSEA